MSQNENEHQIVWPSNILGYQINIVVHWKDEDGILHLGEDLYVTEETVSEIAKILRTNKDDLLTRLTTGSQKLTLEELAIVLDDIRDKIENDGGKFLTFEMEMSRIEPEFLEQHTVDSD